VKVFQATALFSALQRVLNGKDFIFSKRLMKDKIRKEKNEIREVGSEGELKTICKVTLEERWFQ